MLHRGSWSSELKGQKIVTISAETIAAAILVIIFLDTEGLKTKKQGPNSALVFRMKFYCLIVIGLVRNLVL